jgi:hypothetical protein
MRMYIIIYKSQRRESESDAGYSGKPPGGHGLRGFERTPNSFQKPGYGVYRGMVFSENKLSRVALIYF